MNNVIKRVWNKNAMVNIEDLRGMAFQAESGGHTFQISGIDGDGNPVALSGTPAGVLLRSDNQDVTLTCSISDGKVNATLPANAYSVPGRFGITIFLTSDGQKTAIYAAVGTVGKTSSGTVAPPAGSDVVDLVNAIATAVATIPASYTDLMAAMAPTYSSSGLYAVGSYAWYNGKLYRCTTAITSGETWTSGHWTLANIGSDLVDLKSAFNKAVDGLSEDNNLFSNASVDLRPLFINASANQIKNADSSRLIVVPIKENTTYSISCGGASTKRIATTVSNPANNVEASNIVENTGVLDHCYIQNTTGKYLSLQLFIDSDTDKTPSNYYSSIVIREVTANDATAREEISNIESILNKESFPFYDPNSNLLPACKAIKYVVFYKYPNKTIKLSRVLKNSGGVYAIIFADNSGNTYNALNIASSSYTENDVVKFRANGLEGSLVIDWDSLSNGAYNYQSYNLPFSELCYYNAVPDYPFENYNSGVVAGAFIDFAIYMEDPSKDVKLQRVLKKSGGVYYIEISIDGVNKSVLNIAQGSYSEKAYNSFVIDEKTFGYFVIDWDSLSDGLTSNNINKGLNILCKHDLTSRRTEKNVEILVPSTVSVAVGHEISLTYYNIVKCTNIEDYQVVVSPTSAQIQNLSDRLRIVPTTTGNETVTIILYKNDVLITSKSFTLKKVADSAPAIKAIFIGDSMTNAGYYLAELVNMLGSNLTLYGTRTLTVEDADGDLRTVNHEGRPGWSTGNYTGSASVGGVANPFYNNGFDFSYYITNNPSYSDVTDVFILLGTNDGVGTNFAPNYKAICDSIKAYSSDIRIHCMLPIPPIKSGYAFGVRNYIDYLTYKGYIFNSAKKIVTAYDGENGYYVVPVMANLDCYYDFSQTEVAVNSRNPQLVPVGNDNVHPSKYGYYRFSDVIYADIVANCGS